LKKLNLLFLLLAASLSFAQPKPAPTSSTANERATAARLEQVRSNPLLLNAFLRAMPKGGDLHNHLTGAVYAEHYIQIAADRGFCIDRKTLAIVGAPCDPPAGEPAKECGAAVRKPPAKCALQDAVLYRDLIHAMSMRDFVPGAQSGEDHFFDTFSKFGPATWNAAELIAEVATRARRQNEQYLELMVTPGVGAALVLGAKYPWELGNEVPEAYFDRFLKQLQPDLPAIVAAGRKWLDETEADKNQRMRCGAMGQRDGCLITIRYIAQIYRASAPNQVFAQMAASFELASHDGRVVSVNPVQPEDAYVSMHDFDLQMRMFAFFHKLYPQIRLTMHAGELAPGLVPPGGLRYHIRNTISAGAARIGHGVDVMYEDDPIGLLREMAEKRVAIEICLTSNDLILGVRGKQHPFPLYLQYDVPVVIATDDEGVSRSDMTREYQRAVEGYGLTYSQLKQIVRNSIEYSFAPADEKSKLRGELAQTFTEFEKKIATPRH
jgi:adenosine deaminase